MSMISAQVGKLRERAKALRQGRWSDGPEDAKLMEGAADNLWELHCKLAGMVDMRERARLAEAESAKLRKEFEMLVEGYGSMSREHMQLTVEYSDALDKMDELRELARTLWHLLHDWLLRSGEVPYAELDAAHESMKELGIEVD